MKTQYIFDSQILKLEESEFQCKCHQAKCNFAHLSCL